jgi:hypothetical protein
MFWAERLPKTCRVVIPIKLKFSASVGFIHKESVTMHGHTIVKNQTTNCLQTIAIKNQLELTNVQFTS